MSIELLQQADYVLSACGRPTPPPGARWVDLPYVLPFRAQVTKCANPNNGESAPNLHVCPATSLAPNTVVTFIIDCTAGTFPFSLTVSGTTITIVPHQTAPNVFVTTAQDVVNAINASPAALALITISVIAFPLQLVVASSTSTVIAGVTTGVGAAASRIENKARVEFICRGVSIVGQGGVTGVPFRIWWPNGRNLEQSLSSSNFAESGSALRTLQPEVVIEPGGKITIEVGNPTNPSGQVVFFYFWGVLRFPLMAKGDEPSPYLPDISRAPRIPGTQNQNIMAPEWMLGNQCTPETPAGYWDEPFTLFSPAIVNPIGTTTVGVPVECPRDCEWFIIRNIQYNSVKDGTVTAGNAAIQIRMPSGYSLTYGDYLPQDWTGPLFPVLPVEQGGRVILDVGDVDTTGSGNITTTVQFDGVKRRKLS